MPTSINPRIIHQRAPDRMASLDKCVRVLSNGTAGPSRGLREQRSSGTRAAAAQVRPRSTTSTIHRASSRLRRQPRALREVAASMTLPDSRKELIRPHLTSPRAQPPRPWRNRAGPLPAVSRTTEVSVTTSSETDAAPGAKTSTLPNPNPRVSRAPHSGTDRVAGPPLADDSFGEHAAAFLTGNFQPLTEEITASIVVGGAGRLPSPSSSDDENMQMLGNIPADFPAGKFAYVGPNPKFSREHYKVWGEGPNHLNVGFGDGWHHWFEGDGMVYAMDFGRRSEGDGARGVTYRNRYVRTKSWHDELRHGARLFSPLMNASGASFLPHAVANLLRGGYFLKDSANTALTSYGGRLLALQDTMPPWELDGDTLETKGPCDFDGELPFYVPFTAHPKVTPDTGELAYFGFNPVYPPHCSVGSVRPDGTLGPIKSLWHNALKGATFMHDFCITDKHVVLFEGSMNIRPLRMLAGKHPLQYDTSQRARFGVARRGADAGDDEEIIWCECGAHEMVYHFMNAWEDEASGEIVVVGVREDGFFHGALAANGTREWIRDTLARGDSVPRVHEWRIDPSKREVTSERWLFDDVVEVPRINDAYTGRKTRFAYAGRIHESSLADDAQLKFDAVVKFDLETGRTHVHEHGEGRYGMEAQFVPRDGGEGEDDGWLVMYVHDEKNGATEGRSECVVLDARDVEAGPVARVTLPSRVPYGAHAVWEPAAAAAIERAASNSAEREIPGIRADADADRETAAAAVMASPPAPRMFAVAEGQLGALAGAARVGILRAASGLFVNGWRPWIGADDATEYAFVRGFNLRFTEARALGAAREAEVAEELATGVVFGDACRGETPPLTLYEVEGCGASRRVREAVTMLDVACELRPCPLGAVRHRREAAAAMSGDPSASAGEARLPFLEDASTGVKLSGADAIVEYLYDRYLDGAAPSPLVAPGPLAEARAQVAVNSRGSDDGSGNPRGTFRRGPAGAFYARPSRAPERPLQLWAYEASPFCAVVRETLCELEIPYVLQPCARGSTRRTSLARRAGGAFQVPYLEDPNTGVAMFESADIVEYLRSSYQVSPPFER